MEISRRNFYFELAATYFYFALFIFVFFWASKEAWNFASDFWWKKKLSSETSKNFRLAGEIEDINCIITMWLPQLRTWLESHIKNHNLPNLFKTKCNIVPFMRDNHKARNAALLKSVKRNRTSKSIVTPPNSNTFSDWRRTRRVGQTYWLPERANLTNSLARN